MASPLSRAASSLPLIVAVGWALRVAWALFSLNEPVDELHGAETLAAGRGDCCY